MKAAQLKPEQDYKASQTQKQPDVKNNKGARHGQNSTF
jgi:hypothetical protein